MKNAAIKFKNVDEYISMFPAEVIKQLVHLRNIIQKAAPKIQEVISYNMPAYKANGVLVYFAGNKQHIGFYPTSSGVRVYEKELAGYDTSKGTIRFPIEKPLPVKLITQIVKFRLAEDEEKARGKALIKKKK